MLIIAIAHDRMSNIALLRLNFAALRAQQPSHGCRREIVRGCNQVQRARAPTLPRRSCEELYQRFGDDALLGAMPPHEHHDETVLFKKLKRRVELEAPPTCTEVKPDNAIHIFDQQSNSPINDRVLLLKVGDAVVDRLHVSATLLSLASGYFNTLFFGPMREGGHKEAEVVMDSVEEATAVRALVRVVYSRDGTELPSEVNGLCALVNVAEHLGAAKARDAALARLLAKCRYGQCDCLEVLSQLDGGLVVPAVTEISALAYAKELSVMSPLERGLFRGLFGDLWTPEPSAAELMERFQSLPASAVVALVAGPELCLVSEDFVWLAASQWVHHHHELPGQGDDTPAEVEAIFAAVHWPPLSGHLTENVVEKDEFVHASATLRELLQLRKAMGDATDWQGAPELAEKRRGEKDEDLGPCFSICLRVSVDRNQLETLSAGEGRLSSGISYQGLPLRVHVLKTKKEKLAVAIVHERLLEKVEGKMKVREEVANDDCRIMHVTNLRVRVDGSDKEFFVERARYTAGFGYGKSNLFPGKTFEQIINEESPYFNAQGVMGLSVEGLIKVGSARF